MRRTARKEEVVELPGGERRESIQIQAPNFQRLVVKIEGTAPYVQHKFSAKARKEIMAKQARGSQANKGRKRDARNFNKEYEEAMHKGPGGWHGIPAPAFRNAMISACRTVGFKMTLAKLAIFIEANGYDFDDGTPLVKLHGKPMKHEGFVRLESGVVSVAVRPMWKEGWTADLTVKYDADLFTSTDIVNLLMRVGAQVGIGEGRPDSKKSSGMGWGTFKVVEEA